MNAISTTRYSPPGYYHDVLDSKPPNLTLLGSGPYPEESESESSSSETTPSEAYISPRPSPKRNQPATPQSTLTKIKNLVRKSPNLDKTDTSKPGSVYIVPVTHRRTGTHLLKIGCTAEANVHTRLNALRNTCHVDLDWHDEDHPAATTAAADADADGALFGLLPPHHQQVTGGYYYKLVEKLAHAQLERFNYRFDCACGARHQEYFTGVEAGVVYGVVRGWVRFCEARPWYLHGERSSSSSLFCSFFPVSRRGSSGSTLEQKKKKMAGLVGDLKEEWVDRLEGCCREVLALQVGDGGSQVNVEAVAAVWMRFASASTADWLWHDLRRCWASERLAVLLALVVPWVFWQAYWVREVVMWMWVARGVCWLAADLGFKCPTAESVLGHWVGRQGELFRERVGSLAMLGLKTGFRVLKWCLSRLAT
ncbi:hypothetical protein C8A00DRAFT_38009 [Chaetomidium leptoderma]|uniref:Bacteriophage T5 Orf172 DNA-binding domain-containing protein n=1 Tax=Chaetomidium leptoderma TaxID=669021 RepID=A0AAN6VDE2_9PEZI|nr:hypothetical protein C8A00DRAFT_38009 [Chaetomidium leptoderma]